jgi:hypothetical protein
LSQKDFLIQKVPPLGHKGLEIEVSRKADNLSEVETLLVKLLNPENEIIDFVEARLSSQYPVPKLASKTSIKNVVLEADIEKNSPKRDENITKDAQILTIAGSMQKNMDHWVFPNFLFPKPMDFSEYDGLLLEFKVDIMPPHQHEGSFRIFLSDKSGYYLFRPIPVQREWTSVWFDFDEYLPQGDATDTLDLHNITKIRIGANSLGKNDKAKLYYKIMVRKICLGKKQQ